MKNLLTILNGVNILYFVFVIKTVYVGGKTAAPDSGMALTLPMFIFVPLAFICLAAALIYFREAVPVGTSIVAACLAGFFCMKETGFFEPVLEFKKYRHTLGRKLADVPEFNTGKNWVGDQDGYKLHSYKGTDRERKITGDISVYVNADGVISRVKFEPSEAYREPVLEFQKYEHTSGKHLADLPELALKRYWNGDEGDLREGDVDTFIFSGFDTHKKVSGTIRFFADKTGRILKVEFSP